MSQKQEAHMMIIKMTHLQLKQPVTLCKYTIMIFLYILLDTTHTHTLMTAFMCVYPLFYCFLFICMYVYVMLVVAFSFFFKCSILTYVHHVIWASLMFSSVLVLASLVRVVRTAASLTRETQRQSHL